MIRREIGRFLEPLNAIYFRHFSYMDFFRSLFRWAHLVLQSQNPACRARRVRGHPPFSAPSASLRYSSQSQLETHNPPPALAPY